MKDTLTITISRRLRQQLATAAKADGETASEFIRKALQKALVRKSFRTAQSIHLSQDPLAWQRRVRREWE